MKPFWENFWTGFLIGLMMFCFFSIIMMKVEYKLGQIDAINGNIQYELREMDDGSVKWRPIKGK